MAIKKMAASAVLTALTCAFLFAQDAPSGAPEGGDGKNYAETRPGAANRDELTISLSGSQVELDFRKSYLASEAQLFTGLYEGLFSYHPLTMEPVPAAASSWKLSDDKKQWTFTLRENARYWNNDPVRAADFRAAWLSSLEMGDASPYSSLLDIIAGARDYRLGVITDSAKVGIEAPDDRTLIVKLVAPAAFFPSILCHHSFSPVHPSMLKTADWSASPPLSNGPFYIVKDTPEAKVLARNEAYWDNASVQLKKITVKYPETADEASALWNSGEARWIAG
ncbi:MAG: ABC transporter substrate-binding protein, partial [Spirochaetaceae bacterium]|nr:ABC transporter substrate-binding protein [Spirochaetaceae bacterium]